MHKLPILKADKVYCTYKINRRKCFHFPFLQVCGEILGIIYCFNFKNVVSLNACSPLSLGVLCPKQKHMSIFPLSHCQDFCFRVQFLWQFFNEIFKKNSFISSHCYLYFFSYCSRSPLVNIATIISVSLSFLLFCFCSVVLVNTANPL